jgi:hypothetical protein
LNTFQIKLFNTVYDRLMSNLEAAYTLEPPSQTDKGTPEENQLRQQLAEQGIMVTIIRPL